MRASGVLLPISSIPSNYGIGCFSKEAFAFVDQLVRGGQKYWQILPLGPTGYGDSPYQSFSTFAGNPYFIDLEVFIREGYLTEWDCRNRDWGGSESYVDYGKIYNARYDLLRMAFQKFHGENDPEYQKFVEANTFWLSEYSLFTAIKNEQGGKLWLEWPEPLKNRDEAALSEARRRLDEDIRFCMFQQYWFYKQWCWLKTYANNCGIRIIGDVPIYVALDSADTWSNSSLFKFNADVLPSAVAGCPPDGFSPTGQLWGNPVYNWAYHKETGYDWWIKRMQHSLQFYDVIRIDHFRGFDEYYEIPYGDPTAEYGHWEKGPGMELFSVVKEAVPGLAVIAEDLGLLTDSVIKLVEDSGFPGMKVLQFAFDASWDSLYLPHKYNKNCVVYTGTHDTETTRGWFENLSDYDRKFVQAYTACKDQPVEECVWALIRTAQASVAELCIIPSQDYLCLGNEARMNTPGSFGDNWKWRLMKGQIPEDVLGRMRALTRLYGRL